MDDNVRLAVLYDIYGGILTPKQREIFELHYNDDLSLGEISENLGITRQGVRDSLVHSSAALAQAEEQLHFYEDHLNRTELLRQARAEMDAIRAVNGPAASGSMQELERILDRLADLG